MLIGYFFVGVTVAAGAGTTDEISFTNIAVVIFWFFAAIGLYLSYFVLTHAFQDYPKQAPYILLGYISVTFLEIYVFGYLSNGSSFALFLNPSASIHLVTHNLSASFLPATPVIVECIAHIALVLFVITKANTLKN